jgi:hypothetical protein
MGKDAQIADLQLGQLGELCQGSAKSGNPSQNMWHSRRFYRGPDDASFQRAATRLTCRGNGKGIAEPCTAATVSTGKQKTLKSKSGWH